MDSRARLAWLSLEAFQKVLSLSPKYQISILDHDPDAVSLFELAKVLAAQAREREANLPVLPPPRRPLPFSGYLPFGVPQFAQKRPALGAFYASIQIATAAASIGTFVHLAKASKNEPFKPKDVANVKWIRFGIQWPTTILFWATYVASHFQARKHWKKRNSAQPPVTLHIGGTPEVVWLSAQFRML